MYLKALKDVIDVKSYPVDADWYYEIKRHVFAYAQSFGENLKESAHSEESAGKLFDRYYYQYLSEMNRIRSELRKF